MAGDTVKGQCNMGKPEGKGGIKIQGLYGNNTTRDLASEYSNLGQASYDICMDSCDDHFRGMNRFSCICMI